MLLSFAGGWFSHGLVEHLNSFSLLDDHIIDRFKFDFSLRYSLMKPSNCS